jgi:hypothetical protein
VWLWASYVIMGKLYAAGELCIAGELCGSGEVWQWASCVIVGKLGVVGRSLVFAQSPKFRYRRFLRQFQSA